MSAELARLVDGFRVTQAIYAAVELGIPDLLAEGERTSDDLAQASEADPSALYRLLRALASLGVLHEADGRRFSLSPLGQPLRSDAPGSMRGWVRLAGRDHVWRSWGNLASAVRNGENSFRAVHGTDVWEWRAGHPEESAIFDEAMTSLTSISNAAVLAAYDFGRFGTIVDVGGGNGTLLASVLAAHPGTRGILFDQPHVVAGPSRSCAQQASRTAARSSPGASSRPCPTGGDAYVLKSIIHDWEDDESVAILRASRASMGPDAVLLLIERDLGRPNKDPAAKLSDLNMFVMPGGRERSHKEYAELFEQAGLRYVSSALATSGHAVIEAAPAG